jgi:hypothetical protein
MDKFRPRTILRVPDVAARAGDASLLAIWSSDVDSIYSSGWVTLPARTGEAAAFSVPAFRTSDVIVVYRKRYSSHSHSHG